MEFSSKAVVLKAFGSYKCLSVDEFPLPPLKNLIEVKVAYCGMNFADLYTRQGFMIKRKLPFVLGIECVGVISAIGDVNTSLKIGERVICYDYNGGLFRDVVRIEVDKVYRLPDDIPFEVGASLFVNYLTAYFTLLEIGHLKDNETVFIQSCAGGVGFAAIQLARTMNNVTLIGTTSETKQTLMKENGVDIVLSYNNLVTELKKLTPNGLDLIIDNQCGSTFTALKKLLKPLGRIVAIGANELITNDSKISMWNGLKLWWNTKDIKVFSLFKGNKVVAGFHLAYLCEKEPLKIREALNVLYNFFREGKITPKIDSVWPFKDIIIASKILGERHNIGKVLLSVNK